jgi:hypothetical protein
MPLRGKGMDTDVHSSFPRTRDKTKSAFIRGGASRRIRVHP